MMRVLWHMLVKEFLQLVRTPALLFLLILCPVVTVGLVPFGLSNKPRIRVEVVDESFSGRGRETLALLAGSPQITQLSQTSSLQEAEGRMARGEIDAIVIVPANEEASRILVDGSNIPLARDAAYYVGLQLHKPQENELLRSHTLFVTETGNTHYYLVAMLVLLIAIVGCSLVALSVVTEKENKVLEHLRSTGLNPLMYVASKLVFFSLVGLCELAIGLLIARLVFALQSAGPLWELFLLAACFLFAIVNLGILIATSTRTLVRTIYVLVFVFIMLILLSTMFAPLDNMDPVWAATRFVNPFFWMVDGAWKILLKGVKLAANPVNCLALLGIGSVLTAFNILKIRQIE